LFIIKFLILKKLKIFFDINPNFIFFFFFFKY
jgi:hypothetical protein